MFIFFKRKQMQYNFKICKAYICNCSSCFNLGIVSKILESTAPCILPSLQLSGSNANQNKDILGKPFVETQWGCWSNWRRDDWPCDLKCHAGNIPTTSNSADTDCLNTYVMVLVMNVFGNMCTCAVVFTLR